MTIQVLQTRLVPVANDVVTGIVDLPEGYLVSIQPTVIGGSPAPRGGGLYAQAMLLPTNSNEIADSIGTRFAAYVRSGHEPSSRPNERVYAGQRLLVALHAGSDFGGADFTVRFNISVERDLSMPPGGPYLHFEAPGSGKGVLRRIPLAQPAAGADYAPQIVPGSVRQLVRGFYGQLATEAAVGNRVPSIRLEDTAGNVLSWLHAESRQTESTVLDWGAALGAPGSQSGSAPVANASFPLPNVEGRATDAFRMVTRGIAAGDQWSTGSLFVEEWAGY